MIKPIIKKLCRLNCSVFFLLLISGNLHAQSTVIVDSEDNQPVRNASVYSQNGKLIAITNAFGICEIDRTSFPIKINHPGYLIEEFIQSSNDTLFIQPLASDLEEFEVTSITNEKLLNRLIENSQSKISDVNASAILTYYHSMYTIITDTTTGLTDTIALHSIAMFDMVVSFAKKRLYAFYPIMGKRYFVPFTPRTKIGSDQSKTFAVAKFEHFDNLFELELSKTRRLHLNESLDSSERWNDSISYLRFSTLNTERQCYFNLSDTTLFHYSLESISPSGYANWNASYLEKDSLYFL